MVFFLLLSSYVSVATAERSFWCWKKNSLRFTTLKQHFSAPPDHSSAHAPPPRPVFYTPRRFAVGFLFWKSGFTVPSGVLKKTMRWLVPIIAMFQVNHRSVSIGLSHCFFVFLRMRFLCVSLLLLFDACDRKQKPPASLVWARETGGFICYVSSVSGDYNL